MKSKAYCFANAADYDVDDLSETVTFAETPGKAKQNISMESGVHYKDIRVQRIPWADGFKSVDDIPPNVWMDNGWHLVCNTCGAEIEDIADFYVNDKGYCCKKCFDDWSEKNESLHL